MSDASGTTPVDLGAIYRREVGRCTATLVRVLGDIDLAEDAVADAFALAAARWPSDGVPDNPGAWITTTARNRAIDRLRRESGRELRQAAAQRLQEVEMGPGAGDLDDADLAALDAYVDVVPDDQLRLMFLCCHPALSPDAQVAMTLRLLSGLSTDEIAHAFLVPEATISQRIVRAKRKLRDNHAPYRIPRAGELPDRLAPVLTAISLVFTEGHRSSSQSGLLRVELSETAIGLGRVLVELMPDEPEAVGLLALMLLTDARRPSRLDGEGMLVTLAEQDRTTWDATLIVEGHELVRSCLRRNRPGQFQIQAAIAAVHADAPTWEETDWAQVVALYDQLLTLRPDAVVACNRAAAIAERDGAPAGLDMLDAIGPEGLARLETYAPYHAIRAELLGRVGMRDEARIAYDRAIASSSIDAERAFLSRARASMGGSDDGDPWSSGG